LREKCVFGVLELSNNVRMPEKVLKVSNWDRNVFLGSWNCQKTSEWLKLS